LSFYIQSLALALRLHTTVSSCYACVRTSKRSSAKNWHNLVLHLNYKVTRFVSPIGCTSWHLGGSLHCSTCCDYKLFTIVRSRARVPQPPGRAVSAAPRCAAASALLSPGGSAPASLLLSSLPCSVLPGTPDVPHAAQCSPVPCGLSGCHLLKHARRQAELR